MVGDVEEAGTANSRGLSMRAAGRLPRPSRLCSVASARHAEQAGAVFFRVFYRLPRRYYLDHGSMLVQEVEIQYFLGIGL